MPKISRAGGPSFPDDVEPGYDGPGLEPDTENEQGPEEKPKPGPARKAKS